MRRALLPLLVLAISARADVKLDDTYQQVLTEKGAPIGKMQAGDTVILRFADQTVRLKNGKVVAVDAVKNTAPSRVAPATPSAAPAPKATVVAAAPAPATPLAWTTDYHAALATAKEQNRKVFLFFTGSDWCSWCMRLNREVLSTAEFSKYAQENLVLVEVDFPQQKQLSPGVRRQNQTLQRYFQINGYPTIVVLDANGKEVGRTGYAEGGPVPFVAGLKRM